MRKLLLTHSSAVCHALALAGEALFGERVAHILAI